MTAVSCDPVARRARVKTTCGQFGRGRQLVAVCYLSPFESLFKLVVGCSNLFPSGMQLTPWMVAARCHWSRSLPAGSSCKRSILTIVRSRGCGLLPISIEMACYSRLLARMELFCGSFIRSFCFWDRLVLVLALTRLGGVSIVLCELNKIFSASGY